MIDQHAGRNSINGRFVKGWKGGPGNALYRKQHEYRQAWVDAGSDEERAKVRAALVDACLDGDIVAIKFYSEMMYGKAPIEITGLEGDPVKIDMQNLTAVIMTALGDHPQARYAVAQALYSISRTQPEGTASDGPGSSNGDPA